MEAVSKILRPIILEVQPTSQEAPRVFKHWKFVLSQYLTALPNESNDLHLGILARSLSPNNFELISECGSYDAAIQVLNSIFIKPPNNVVARHTLMTRRQLPQESIDEYARELQRLSVNCGFRDVTASSYRNEYIRDSFISGLKSPIIRTRLLECSEVSLVNAVDKARALELAHQDSLTYEAPGNLAVVPPSPLAPLESLVDDTNIVDSSAAISAATPQKRPCFFCGKRPLHDRSVCPARDILCSRCHKKGHFAKVCKSSSFRHHQHEMNTAASTMAYSFATFDSAFPPGLQSSSLNISIKEKNILALIDTGSTENFVSLKLVSRLQLPTTPYMGTIAMASSSWTSSVSSCCSIVFNIKGKDYRERFLVLPNCCTDVILGLPFLKQHSSLKITFGGDNKDLEICALTPFQVTPPRIFTHLSPDFKPIAAKSRRYSSQDSLFIKNEIQRLLTEDIIEPSCSPWRAQIHIVNQGHKKRMVIDYSTTINRFTYLDAYPLPSLETLVNKIASYKVYSSVDLRSAYHCVPLHPDDKIYTAFEADGKLYQFRRLSFGLTNGVSCFQRVIDEFIKNNGLIDTFAYLDDVTICGRTQEEHDWNLARFLDCAKRFHMTFSPEKCKFSLTTIRILGYEITHGKLRPDPSRMQPLLDLPIPTTSKSLSRLLGLFAYYSRWIPSYSNKLQPLIHATFPLTTSAITAIQELKDAVLNAVHAHVDDTLPFIVETDASDGAIAATLNQDGRPVAFFSRSLSSSEKGHCSLEKEAYAIIEAVRHWRHYLLPRPFTLVTDQKSVSFMFDLTHKSKIKNEKLARWRLELLPYKFEIHHRPGSHNLAADALSRIRCSATTMKTDLITLHDRLCHPGIARFSHYLRTRNIPFSTAEIRQITSSCPTCCRLKPQFYRPDVPNLIHAIRPFDRLSVDFKGPLSCTPGSRHRYLLVIVDEYSRFPFAFPCSDLTSQTVISCLASLFSMFGTPGYIHSDRGTAFMSASVRDFLTNNGIATSRSTPYHPTGNGQCERYVGLIWKAVTLALDSQKLPPSSWEAVLPQALHSLRTLLCTATNATPHERLFSFPRRSCSGHNLPTWLATPGKVLLRNYVRTSEDPLVQEVDLLEANPYYAFIRFPSGREDTVSVRDLAPSGIPPSPSSGPSVLEQPSSPSSSEQSQISSPPPQQSGHLQPDSIDLAPPSLGTSPQAEPSNIRRSTRISRPVQRYGYTSLGGGE